MMRRRSPTTVLVLNENVPNDTLVGQVIATDDVRVTTFFIIGNNAGNAFQIDDTNGDATHRGVY